MSQPLSVENEWARDAQTKLRVLGVMLIAIGSLAFCCLSGIAMDIGSGGDAQVKGLLLLAAIYLTPGIASIVLSRSVGSQSMGSTIAALVISILMTSFMVLVMIAVLFSMKSNPAEGLISLILFVLQGYVAILAAVYCGKSLAWIRRHGPNVRGFEPIMTDRPGDRTDSQ